MSTRLTGAGTALSILVAIIPAHAAEEPADEVVVTATRERQRIAATIQHT